MTKVDLSATKGYLKIRIQGHAGYGSANQLPEGHDIVCAAISILGQSIVQRVITLSEEGKVEICGLCCKPGHIRIRAIAKMAYADELQGAADVVRTGFELLEDEYPEYIDLGWGHTEKECDMVSPEGVEAWLSGKTVEDAQERL